MKTVKWARLGKAAASVGKSRSEVLNELTDWYLRDRPTSRMHRPPRVDLTPDEIAALSRGDDAPKG